MICCVIVSLCLTIIQGESAQLLQQVRPTHRYNDPFTEHCSFAGLCENFKNLYRWWSAVGKTIPSKNLRSKP